MTTSAMRRLPSIQGLLPVVALAMWASIAATDPAAAQSAPANPPAAGTATPPAAAPNDAAAAELAEWR